MRANKLQLARIRGKKIKKAVDNILGWETGHPMPERFNVRVEKISETKTIYWIV
jgi:hypothetical protein